MLNLHHTLPTPIPKPDNPCTPIPAYPNHIPNPKTLLPAYHPPIIDPSIGKQRDMVFGILMVGVLPDGDADAHPVWGQVEDL